jgi:chromosome segregation ATPase
MQRLKSVVSVIVIGVSLVMLVLSLAGIVWGWNAMAQLSNGIVNVLTEAETRLQEVDQGLDQVDTTLTQVRQEIADAEENVAALGADTEQNGRLMTVISDTVGAKVVPLVNKANTAINTFQETITVIDSTVATLNTLPFMSIPTPELATLRQISDELATLQTAVSELQTTLSERRAELIQGAVALLTASLTRIDQILESVQTRVGGYIQRLDATQTRLAQLKDSIPTALNMVALVNMLVLLWLAFAQVGLLIHSWRFLTGKDLLARWQ